MIKVDANSLINDILRQYPETREVFIANGFEEFAYNELVEQIGNFLRLKTVLKVKKINEEIFLKLLENQINYEYSREFKNKKKLLNNWDNNINKDRNNDRLNMLALLPCPLKFPLEEEFNRILNKEAGSVPETFDYLIEGNANNQLSYYPYVDQFEDLDEIPDIIISPGLNKFFHKRFVEKYIDKGFFVDAAEFSPNKALVDIGIKDPGGNYTILSLNLLIMVVDYHKLGNRSIPKTWGDILNPEFEKKVAIRGQNNFFCETTLLTIYKQYGVEGIRKLARSVKYGWHPSQMAKSIGSSEAESPLICVMPYFFTKTIKHKKNVTVIWPEDGAIISPVSMLVKAEKAQKLKRITEFFTGSDVGKICAGASFPSLNPEVDNKIPENARFNWLGWDYIKSNDIGQIIDDLNKEFLQYY